jgi:hypothetical protein
MFRDREVGKLETVLQGELPISLRQVLGTEFEFVEEYLAHGLGHPGLDFQADNGSRAPFTEGLCNHREQVFGLLLFAPYIGIPDHPEGIRTLDSHPPEEILRPMTNQLLDRDVVARAFGFGDGDPSPLTGRDLEASEVMSAPPGVAHPDPEGKG